MLITEMNTKKKMVWKDEFCEQTKEKKHNAVNTPE